MAKAVSDINICRLRLHGVDAMLISTGTDGFDRYSGQYPYMIRWIVWWIARRQKATVRQVVDTFTKHNPHFTLAQCMESIDMLVRSKRLAVANRAAVAHRAADID